MYSRRRCGLCDEARVVIDEVRLSKGFSFDEVLIDGDDRLELDYGIRVPVVEVDGVERFEYHVDAGALADLLT